MNSAQFYDTRKIDSLLSTKQDSFELSDYYKKNETSSSVELAQKFNTLSTYSQTKSQLSNDGYLTSHQSLSDYYTKSQTSSSNEISGAINDINIRTGSIIAATISECHEYTDNSISDIPLSDYYKKNETSSSNELSLALRGIHKDIFKTMSMIKPYSDNRMFCELTASKTIDFTNAISTDSSLSNQLFIGFKLNNVSSEWTVQPEDGFTTDFNNQPIVFMLGQFLSSNNVFPSSDDLIYMKWKWYSIDSLSAKHMSDTYSTVIPTNTEVGANSHDVTSRREFNNLRSQLLPSRQDIGIEQEYEQYYEVKKGIFSNITSDIRSNDKFLLNDYDFSNEYRMRFKTVSADSDISVSFYVDLGNGPQINSNMSISSHTFIPNAEYVIEVKYDSIIVDYINRQDVVNYLRENSNSVTLRIW